MNWPTQEQVDYVFHHRSPAFLDDCRYIVQVAQSMGLKLENWQAEKIWEWYSAQMDAQWLHVVPTPERQSERDNEIRGAIADYIAAEVGQ